MKDTRHADKVTAKAAKEMYEHGLKVENEYRSYISGMYEISVLYRWYLVLGAIISDSKS